MKNVFKIIICLICLDPLRLSAVSFEPSDAKFTKTVWLGDFLEKIESFYYSYKVKIVENCSEENNVKTLISLRENRDSARACLLSKSQRKNAFHCVSEYERNLSISYLKCL